MGNIVLILFLSGDFPGGPVVGTLCFHCRGHGFDPWLGNWILHAKQRGQKYIYIIAICRYTMALAVKLACYFEYIVKSWEILIFVVYWMGYSLKFNLCLSNLGIWDEKDKAGISLDFGDFSLSIIFMALFFLKIEIKALLIFRVQTVCFHSE